MIDEWLMNLCSKINNKSRKSVKEYIQQAAKIEYRENMVYV